MILSDIDIVDELDNGLGIEPCDWDEQLQPASIDLRLGNEFRQFVQTQSTHIDPRESLEQYTELIEVDDEFVLHPGQFVLGETREVVTMPNHLCANVEGRSSYGRLAVVVHATAGFIDPGFEATITLELANLGTQPVVLRPDSRICQLVVKELRTATENGYDGKYQGQSGPTVSQLHEEL